MTDFKVIGAGLGRTGTLSLKIALEQLGFEPCHHFIETVLHPERNHDFYAKHAEDANNEEAIKEFFAGYLATVDFPGAWFYEKFMEWNPDAKVILTVRDTPESYVKSTQATSFCSNANSNWLSWKLDWWLRCYYATPHSNAHRSLIKRHLGVNPNHYKTDLGKMYTDWNAKVQRVVPAEKLLVFNVKEGWAPLCEFLGVPVPDTPFPRVNSTEQYNSYSGNKAFLRARRAVFGIQMAIGIVVIGVLVKYGLQLLGLV